MFHITSGIFGNAELAGSVAKKLGKQGTANDIVIYNHGSSEGVFTYITVNSDKIQPLLQAINMIDVPVLAVNELNAAVGEQIVAISEFGYENGFVLLENMPREQIAPLVKGTCIENFIVVNDIIELVEALKKIKINRPARDLLIPVDNYFNVKGVGTVVLGIIKSGTVRKYDKAVIEPLGKEVVIKGMQSQDKDIEQAEAGMRVGLNLKGIELDELKRGYTIGNVMKSTSFKLDFKQSKYSREKPKGNDQIFVSSGLQVTTASVRSVGDKLEIETENPVAYNKDTKFLVASTKQILPRIIGTARF